MSDRFTLIDVMRGIRKHGLIDRLSPECFTFLIGLILEANELGFKNPIGMSTRQALSIGGGTTRQTVYNRRKKLATFKIDGKPLVTVKAGSRAHNNVATYEIDYNLLCSYNGVWSMSAADMLKQSYSGSDSGVYSEGDSGSDSALTIHRSDQKRGEENDDDRLPPETEEDERHDMITDALKEGIGGDPKAITLVSNERQLAAFNEIMEHKDEHILDVIDAAALKGKLHQDNALMYVRTGLRNGWYNSQPGGGGNNKSRISKAEIRKGLDDMAFQREAVLLAPESDFTERRITREKALDRIDEKMYTLRSMMEE